MVVEFSPLSEAIVGAGAVVSALVVIGGVAWRSLRVINRLAGVIGEDDKGRTLMARMDEADARLESVEGELGTIKAGGWADRIVTLEGEVRDIWHHIGSGKHED